jgi:hypothetical protein
MDAQSPQMNKYRTKVTIIKTLYLSVKADSADAAAQMALEMVSDPRNTIDRLPGDTIITGKAIDVVASEVTMPQLENAIREYLTSHGYEVTIFYPAPHSIKVSFLYAKNSYWTLKSVLPADHDLSTDDIARWLYKDFVNVQMNKFLAESGKVTR